MASVQARRKRKEGAVSRSVKQRHEGFPGLVVRGLLCHRREWELDLTNEIRGKMDRGVKGEHAGGGYKGLSHHRATAIEREG